MQRGVCTLTPSSHHELVLGIEHAEAWPQEEEISGEGRRPPGQGARHTVQQRITRGPGVVVRHAEPPVPRGRRWPMRQGLWPTVWHRVTRRPGVVRRWPGGIRRARPIEGPQEAKPATWVVAEELPIPTCGILL